MKTIFFTAIFISSIFYAVAQDVHFSQFNQTPLIINPALTGSGLGIHRAGLNYREQGTFFTKGYISYSAFYDGKYSFKKRTIKNKNSKQPYFGIGGVFINDRAGDSKMGTTNIGLSVAYFMELIEKHVFSIGFQGSFGQRSIDYSDLRWDSQYINNSFSQNNPPEYLKPEENFSYPDVATGISWRYTKDRFFKSTAGIALHHVNSIKLRYLDVENQILDRKINIHGQAEYMFKSTVVTLIPSFLYQRQGKLQELVYGTLVKLQVNEKYQDSKFLESYVGLGLFNRHNDSFTATLVISSKNTRIGINYDFNYSSLKRASNFKGAIETSVVFHIPYQKRRGGNTLI
ncbi:MAG: hypothetical protein Kow0068_25070 [Marinilabiliales bacterium]